MELQELLKSIKKIKFDKEGIVGTNIFEFIQTSDVDNITTVSDCLASIFPSTEYIQKNAQISHTPVCLLVRNVFGTLYKNGTLLDLMHPDRKEAYEHNKSRIKDWEKSFIFTDALEKSFIKINNRYGLVILYEMLAHRYGDFATFSEGDEQNKNIEKMCDYYQKSYELCTQNKLVKQLFTPWYWGGLYLAKLDKKEKAIDWLKMFHKLADKYMSGRDSYRNKFSLSLTMMQKVMTQEQWNVYYQDLRNSIKNKSLKKVL